MNGSNVNRIKKIVDFPGKKDTVREL